MSSSWPIFAFNYPDNATELLHCLPSLPNTKPLREILTLSVMYVSKGCFVFVKRNGKSKLETKVLAIVTVIFVVYVYFVIACALLWSVNTQINPMRKLDNRYKKSDQTLYEKRMSLLFNHHNESHASKKFVHNCPIP